MKHRILYGLLFLLVALRCADGQSAPPVAIPIAGLPLNGTPILLQATANPTGGINLRLVKPDASVIQTPAPDGSILISAIPTPPSMLQLTSVLWVPFVEAPTQPPGVQMWCSQVPLPSSWQPVAITEARVNSTTGVPVSFQTFYLVASPSQAGGAATANGLTWVRSSSLCAGAGAISFTPASLANGDQRLQIYALVAS